MQEQKFSCSAATSAGARRPFRGRQVHRSCGARGRFASSAGIRVAREAFGLPVATSQSPARAYLTRCALSNQAWMTSHLSACFDRKLRREDRASCSSKKNFSESLPVASPGAIRCFLIHRSHSWINKRFACSCFITVRPTSNSRPGHSSNKRFQNSFSR
jgi:hypothetical protein